MVNQAQRAYHAWNTLISCAAQRTTITYGALGAAIGIHHRPIKYVLELIQEHCISEGLPPITILATDRNGRIGRGFFAFDLDRRAEGLASVYDHQWQSIENPFSFAADGQLYEKIVTELATTPSSAGDVMRLVKSRGMAQVMFRDALLECYGRQCAFTGMSFTEALEACHIVPWSACSPEERLDVRNGILLNSLHHALFDKGWMTIDLAHRIQFVDPEMLHEPYSYFDKVVSVDLHGKQMLLPKNPALAPAAEFIQKHHEAMEKMNQ
ncbi:HNH endonuclease [Pseudomonas cannabina]|uniref:HNH endonuclease n=1 Tax=Pseudomonas cannabina pv. alisalensis TaxID=757414 RepID=A0ABS1XIX6_PSEC1|nr:HNH endonuclease [Pseudomonas cannabina]MBM0141456.1 HNH endonuclease [Pseudomonas cannabina pv. alisalensis]